MAVCTQQARRPNGQQPTLPVTWNVVAAFPRKAAQKPSDFKSMRSLGTWYAPKITALKPDLPLRFSQILARMHLEPSHSFRLVDYCLARPRSHSAQRPRAKQQLWALGLRWFVVTIISYRTGHCKGEKSWAQTSWLIAAAALTWSFLRPLVK